MRTTILEECAKYIVLHVVLDDGRVLIFSVNKNDNVAHYCMAQG